MKFEIGDRVVVVPCRQSLYDNTFEDLLNQHFTVLDITVYDDGTWYDCGEFNIVEFVLIPEELYNSPLYKALR
jgi:hypothetical protein